MAIGDLVPDIAGHESRALIKATARLDGALDAGDLVDRRRFRVAGGKSFNGLAALLEEYHGSFSYGTEEFGIETVAVPFSHLFFHCEASPVRRDRLELDVERRIESRWKGAIDPLVGARADFLDMPASAPDTLEVFFGSGVFVPPKGAIPVGSIELQLLDGSPAEAPLLDRGRPAGFYTGQQALAFASRGPLAPAVVDAVVPEPFVMLLAPGKPETPSRPLVLVNLKDAGSHEDYATRENSDESVDDDEIKQEFVVAFKNSDRFLVRYRADTRPSRLCRLPRPGRLAITGIVEPHDGRGPRSDHWWLDLDAAGLMLGSALVPKVHSIAVRGRDRLRGYDWRTLAEERKVARSFTIELAATQGGPDGGGLRLLRRNDDRPFGYLEPPPSPQAVSFAADASGSYVLDWVDLATGAEILWNREGLGSLSRVAKDGGIVFAPRGAGWAARSSGGLLYREASGGVFERCDEVPWQPGGQLVIEPLCLTMLA